MLFVDFESQSRIRVNGVASIDLDDPLAAEFPEAQFVVRVRAREVFFNCPRYIHKMQLVELSTYAPQHDHTPPVPEWKKFEVFHDALPKRDREE